MSSKQQLNFSKTVSSHLKLTIVFISLASFSCSCMCLTYALGCGCIVKDSFTLFNFNAFSKPSSLYDSTDLIDGGLTPNRSNIIHKKFLRHCVHSKLWLRIAMDMKYVPHQLEKRFNKAEVDSSENKRKAKRMTEQKYKTKRKKNILSALWRGEAANDSD